MKTITSKSFLDVAEQVELLKKDGYTLESPISIDDEGNYVAIVVRATETAPAPKESVQLDKPKRGPKPKEA